MPVNRPPRVAGGCKPGLGRVELGEEDLGADPGEGLVRGAQLLARVAQVSVLVLALAVTVLLSALALWELREATIDQERRASPLLAEPESART